MQQMLRLLLLQSLRRPGILLLLIFRICVAVSENVDMPVSSGPEKRESIFYRLSFFFLLRLIVKFYMLIVCQFLRLHRDFAEADLYESTPKNVLPLIFN